MVSAVTVSASAAAEKFTDVNPNKWYYTAVDYAVDEGLFKGTSATTFSPDEPMTRGMFVTVLGNKAKVDAGGYPDSSFSDVEPGKWYTPFVEWAAENKIVNGTGNGKFAPDRNVTREQMAVILYNYAKFTDCDLTVQAGLLDKFPDGNRTSDFAKYAMEWALTHEVINGTGGALDPLGTASRAQVAQIFYNSRELLAGSGDEPAPPSPSPSPDVTPSPSPSPSPSPDPDAPHIIVSDEVRSKLKDNLNPEKLLDYVLNGKNDDPTFGYDGTTAVWDASLPDSQGVGKKYLGDWNDDPSEYNETSTVANGFVQMLTRTASDKFYITADEETNSFCLYYHPAEVKDSAKMREIKSFLNLPNTIKYDRSLCYEGAGWAGPMSWEPYGGAKGIAESMEYVLMDMHQAIQYYITEPTPGVFYLLYGE